MNNKGDNLVSLKINNKRQILKNLYTKGAMSRVDLSKAVNLTSAAITKLVNEMIKDNLVKDTGEKVKKANGRPEVLIGIDKENKYFLGIEIQSDFVKFYINEFDRVINYKEYVTQDLGYGKSLVSAIATKIKYFAKKYDFIAVGITVSGIVNESLGVSVNSLGLLEENSSIVHILEKRVGLPVYLGHDIRTLGESLVESKKDNFILVSLTPVLGSAIIMDGETFRGYSSRAGDVAHIIMDNNNKKCKCGKTGCLETLISQTALLEDYNKQSKEKITDINEFYERYINKDFVASFILNKALISLEKALINLDTIFNPEKIILTGGIFENEMLAEMFVTKLISKINCNVKLYLPDTYENEIRPCVDMVIKKSFIDKGGILNNKED